MVPLRKLQKVCKLSRLWGGGGNYKIFWNVCLIEKLEMQLDEDLEESNASQMINSFLGGGFLKLGKYLILPLNLTLFFLFEVIVVTAAPKPKLSQFCFQGPVD